MDREIPTDRTVQNHVHGEPLFSRLLLEAFWVHPTVSRHSHGPASGGNLFGHPEKGKKAIEVVRSRRVGDDIHGWVGGSDARTHPQLHVGGRQDNLFPHCNQLWHCGSNGRTNWP